MGNRLYAKLGVFGAVPIIILRDKRITPNALKVYIAIRSIEGGKEGCEARQTFISERSGVPEDGITEAVRLLHDTGWLDVTRRPNRPNLYETCAPLRPVGTDRADGRAGGNGNVANFRLPEHSPEPDSGNIPDTAPGNIPDTLKEHSLKSTEEKGAPRKSTAPRSSKRPPHENDAFKQAAALFEERGGVWAAGTKEAVSLWALIDTAKKQAPDLWEDLLGNLMGIMWALCQGKIPSKGEFWNRAGYTPSMMRSRWSSLLAYIKTKQTPEEYAREILEAVP